MEKKKRFKDLVEMDVFVPVVIGLVLVLIWSGLNYESFAKFSNTALVLVKYKFSSFINLVITACLLSLIILFLGKRGDQIIGGPNAKPDVNFFSYFTMALCGVIGVGIVFWGIAEPLTHFSNPPVGTIDVTNIAQKATFAVSASMAHWSFHLYGIYSLVGLALALGIYTYKLPIRISSMFYPIFGERVEGKVGKYIDAFCIFAYICATGTTFSFAALQLTAGVSHFTGLEATKFISVIIILVITAVYTISSCSGIKKGVSYSSQLNFGAYILLLVFAFFIVNPQFVTELSSDALAKYLNENLINGGLVNDAFRVNKGWSQNWTIFYWTWGIATALVTSVFLAKISRGRTIRQFIIVNLILPSCFAFVWFGIFGSSAIYLDYFKEAGIALAMATKGTEFAAFEYFSALPLSKITIPLFFLAAAISFTTCANSVVTAMASMSQKISEEDIGNMTEPPMILKLTYSFLVAGISIAVLFLGGAAEIQAAAVAVGLPTAFMIVLGIIGLFKFLSPSYEEKFKNKKQY